MTRGGCNGMKKRKAMSPRIRIAAPAAAQIATGLFERTAVTGGGGGGGYFSGTGVALQALQVRAKFGGALVADVAIFFQSRVDDPFEIRGKIGIDAGAGAGGLLRMASKMAAVVSPRNGKQAGCGFVQYGAEGKKIGAGVEFLAQRLLGGHVGDGSQRAPALVR